MVMCLWILSAATLLYGQLVDSYPSCDIRMFENNYLFLLNDHGISYYAFDDYSDYKAMNKAVDDHLWLLCHEQPPRSYGYYGHKLFYSTNYTHLIVTLAVKESKDFRIGIVELEKLLNLPTNFLNYDDFLLDYYALGNGAMGSLRELPRDEHGNIFRSEPREMYICDAEKAVFNHHTNVISFPSDQDIHVSLVANTARVDPSTFDRLMAYLCFSHNAANEKAVNFHNNYTDKSFDLLGYSFKGLYINQAVGRNYLKAEKPRDPDSPYKFTHYYQYQAVSKVEMCQVLEVKHNLVPRALIIPVSREDRERGEAVKGKYADPKFEDKKTSKSGLTFAGFLMLCWFVIKNIFC